MINVNTDRFSCTLVIHFVIKPSDKKNEERRFDRSTVIFKFKFMDRKFRIYTVSETTE